MLDDLSFYLLVLGVVLLGLVWISSPKAPSHERENRNLLYEKEIHELMNVMAAMKQDFEKQLHALSQEIHVLEQEVTQLKSKPAATAAIDNQDALLLDNRYREIFDMRQQGLSNDVIARKLDMGTGEVALIVQLHNLTAEKNKKPALERDQHHE
jgi:thioesterase domain-containing protein